MEPTAPLPLHAPTACPPLLSARSLAGTAGPCRRGAAACAHLSDRADRAGRVRRQDVGHSKHARTLLEKYYIGEYVGGPSSLPAKAAKGAKGASAASGNPNAGARLLHDAAQLVVNDGVV